MIIPFLSQDMIPSSSISTLDHVANCEYGLGWFIHIISTDERMRNVFEAKKCTRIPGLK